MTYALLLAALTLGLAGSLHCVAMCSGASAALLHHAGGGPWAIAGFLLARLLGYAAAGAVLAAGVGALALLAQWSPVLRPLWVLAHIAALALGLWLLVTARQPAWLVRLGSGRDRAAGVAASPGGWQPVAFVAAGSAPQGRATATATAPAPRRWWPLAGGLLWFAWPCGLLQSALMVAALANTPAGGAAVMATFALASAPALGLAPWLLARLGSGGDTGRWLPPLVRLSGALLAGASAWALGHDVFVRVIDYCLS